MPSPSARDKKALEDAERELARVRRAKEKLGGGDHHLHGQSHRDQPSREGGPGGGGRLLGKRTTREWDGADGRKGIGRTGAGQDEADAGSTSGEETDVSVRAIPMPRDTPPPIPHPSRNRNRPHPHPQHAPNVQNATTSNLTNANLEPVSSARGLDTQPLSQPGSGSSAAAATAAAASPPPPPKTVYEAKPIVRDLRKEAVNKFVPEAVRRRKIVDPVPTGTIPGMTAAAPAAAQAAAATAAKTEPETRNIQIVSSSLHQQPISPGRLASPILQSPPPSSTQEYQYQHQHQHQQEQKQEHEEEAEAEEELIASAPSRTTQEISSSSTETQQTQSKATKKLPLTLLYGDDPTTDDETSSEEEQTQTKTPNPNPNHDSNRDSNADIDKVLAEEEKRFREETWK